MSDNEQQLNIWKDLAISKQMLMNEAASTLKLKSEWTQEDLKVALDDAIKKGASAASDIKTAVENADAKVADAQERLRLAEKAKAKADADVEESTKSRQSAESQLANGRKDNAEALKKAKQQVAEKERELKAINTALADTPENVVKKLKNLKRQKHEENQARLRAEDTNRKLKKENKALQDEAKEQTDLAEKGARLAEQYRSLRDLCEKQQETLKKADLESDEIPDLDYSALDAFEGKEEVDESKKEAAHA